MLSVYVQYSLFPPVCKKCLRGIYSIQKKDKYFKSVLPSKTEEMERERGRERDREGGQRGETETKRQTERERETEAERETERERQSFKESQQESV